MLFHIKHTTRYSYSRTVFCEPFTVRLRPREDSSQRLLRYQLSVDPQPAGICDFIDVEGNAATQCWFNSPTCSLTLTGQLCGGNVADQSVRFFAQRRRPAIAHPLSSGNRRRLWLPIVSRAKQTGGPVKELAEQIQTESDRQTVPFLTKLASWISENFEKTIQAEPEIQIRRKRR